MCLLKQRGLHEAAGEYYYDLLAEYDPNVPVSIVRHVRWCLLCRRRILRLRDAIIEVGGEAYHHETQMDRDIIDTLSLHFHHLGEHVTCARARPLLPGLFSPSRVRIPTPITVHVDHCPSCAKDRETIQGLSLDGGRLKRLEWLYGQSPEDDLSFCAMAESAIPTFACGDPGHVDPVVLRHLCTCPACRSRVYDYRQRLLRAMPARVGGAACSQQSSTADLFDCLIPYDPADADEERPANSHVHGCAQCLERLQSLHREIYGIAERADSGIVTVYKVADVGQEPPTAPGNRYAGYPVNVDVIHRPPGPPLPPPAVGVPLRRRTADPRARGLLKAAIAAAAVIPLAILFFATRTATGITLAQIVEAFGRAENVHVVRLYPPTGEITQEFWITRSAKYFISRNAEEHVLYDLAENEKRYAHSMRDPGNVSQLGDEEAALVHKKLMGCLGFTLGDVPADAEWNRLSEEAARGAEVYELNWVDRTDRQSPLLVRYEVVLDPLTRLPARINLFCRRPDERQWESRMSALFEYDIGVEIGSMLKRDFLLDGSLRR